MKSIVLLTRKRSEAAGPDQATAEMYTLFDTESVGILTNAINGMWDKEELPTCICNAYIATLFKKMRYRQLSKLQFNLIA